ncbi:glutathione peroxidase [Albirhodobacter sp. R86504]|uniref:glutathione peroxidase n=1 Tax=Albirhodobacter sp. R86504 TaxID=3093848 RepID=UPI00366C2294
MSISAPHRSIATAVALWGAMVVSAHAEPVPDVTFPSIDGGEIATKDWRGHPVLVVNTASLCGFAGQLEDMQALHEELGPKGLIVLAVPSNDFNQELEDAATVKEYCSLEYGVTLPMTDIVSVAKGDVHPFYQWLKASEGFVPKWNFYKVLIDANGEVVETYSSVTAPDAQALRRDIDAAF